MKCDKCGGELEVTDTRNRKKNVLYRRRKCLVCGYAFSSFEFPADDIYSFDIDFKAYGLKRPKAMQNALED